MSGLSDNGEQMAIIKDIKYGYVERAGVCVSFTVSGEHWGAGVILDPAKVAEWLKENYIEDLKSLNGKPCIVKVEGGIVTFKRFIKI